MMTLVVGPLALAVGSPALAQPDVASPYRQQRAGGARGLSSKP